MIEWTDTNLGAQKAVTVVPEAAHDRPILVIFLHADSPFRDPVYQYEIARSIAQSRPGIVAVSILRPGYTDGCGDRSDGSVGRKMGDNYTAAVVASLAATIRAARQVWQPTQTIVMGHSGGAALAALLAATHPDLQDRTVLVACPCDLPAWRDSMAELNQNPTWRDPMPGLSPIDFVDGLDSEKPVDIWVGDADIVTPPRFSEAYERKARSAGKRVTLREVSGGDHDMILDAATLASILATFLD